MTAATVHLFNAEAVNISGKKMDKNIFSILRKEQSRIADMSPDEFRNEFSSYTFGISDKLSDLKITSIQSELVVSLTLDAIQDIKVMIGSPSLTAPGAELISSIFKGIATLLGGVVNTYDLSQKFGRDQSKWGMTYACNSRGPCAPVVWKN